MNFEAGVYSGALTAFAFVLCGAARMRHEMLLVASIPAVFVSLVMGFVMGIHAWYNLGPIMPTIAVLVGGTGAWLLAARYTSKDLLLAMYLVWAFGLVFALIGVRLPDPE